MPARRRWGSVQRGVRAAADERTCEGAEDSERAFCRGGRRTGSASGLRTGANLEVN